MASPRSEFRAARVVAVATLLVALAIIVVGFLVLRDDYRQRSNQRAEVEATSQAALEQRLSEFDEDVMRQLAVAEQAGIQIAEQVAEADEQPEVALAAAVIDARLGRTLPALDRVFYQDQVAQVVGVDEFGSPTGDPRDSGYDPKRIIDASVAVRDASFADDQGELYYDDGIAAYYPLPSDAGWVVLILRGGELAADGVFMGLADSGSSFVAIAEPSAQLTSVQPFASRQFVSRLNVDLPGGDPASWTPFLVRLVGLLAALGGVLVLGVFVRRNYDFASRRLQNAETTPYGAGAEFEENIIGVVELDEMGIITGVNQAYCEQVGRDRQDLIGMSLLAITDPADRTRHLAALDKLMTGVARKTQVEHRVLNERSDSETWVLEHLSRNETSDGSKILVQSQDITFRRYATWELAKQALHDELTGLANRAMLVHRLRAALSQGADADGQTPTLGVMFIDVDRFKLVNDSLGHDVGDRLIKHVGERMETAVRVNDTVSRFGGDEFVVLCDRLTGVSEAMAVAERIRLSLAAPYTDDGATIHPTLSIGIAVCRAGEMTADELLRDADAAMYRAKERGRNRVEVFDEGMRKLLVEQMTLESELRHAIDTEQIAMYFQPIVDSATYATAGFEALIRWPHPVRGLLTPGQFLGVAEEAGLQGRLDTVALKITCQQMARWAAKYPMANNLYVSANKVPKNFPKFVQQIREIIASTGLPPGLLVVEVVENALLDDADGALQAIEALKEMGVRVAIDDFGTGYSSLSYLTQFRPTTLKIDRAFVSLLPEDAATASVVQAITEMALALNINVIAEGVETWEQAEVLHRMGVPYFQGYLFAKPRPADEIEAWLASNGADPQGDSRYSIDGESRRARVSSGPN